MFEEFCSFPKLWFRIHSFTNSQSQHGNARLFTYPGGERDCLWLWRAWAPAEGHEPRRRVMSLGSQANDAKPRQHLSWGGGEDGEQGSSTSPHCSLRFFAPKQINKKSLSILQLYFPNAFQHYPNYRKYDSILFGYRIFSFFFLFKFFSS